MIGSEKQIQYARAIISGARALCAQRMQDPRGGRYWAARGAAIDFIVAVDEQRLEDALALYERQDFPGWVLGEYVVAKRENNRLGWSRTMPESIEETVVVAGNVIDALKGDYYEWLKSQSVTNA